jgi:hypothetical protein
LAVVTLNSTEGQSSTTDSTNTVRNLNPAITDSTQNTSTLDNDSEQSNVTLSADHIVATIDSNEAANSRFPLNSPPSAGQQLKLNSVKNMTPVERKDFESHSERNVALAFGQNSSTRDLFFGFWNVNADNLINADTHRIYIREVLEALECDILALQELKWVPDRFDNQLFSAVDIQEDILFLLVPVETQLFTLILTLLNQFPL